MTRRPTRTTTATMILTFGILITASAGRPTRAALVLDQSNVPTTSSGYADDAIGSASVGDLASSNAQTFTAGLSGLLAQVDVLIAQEPGTTGGDVTLTIRSVVGGLPSAALFQTTIPLASIPERPRFTSANPPLTSVDVSAADIMIHPGDILAIVLSRAEIANPPWVTWRSRGETYAGGAGFQGNPTSGAWHDIHGDHGFQTFVSTPAAVPEPSSLALAGLGALSLLGYCRRRRLTSAYAAES